MNNKKAIMFFSAIFIVIYHLWINVTKLNIEIFLKQLCVIGVDLFFFVSSYNIGKRKEINYKEFIKNRFGDIYFKFLVLSIIYVIYKKYSFTKFLSIVLFKDFFIKGGGSFLWFIPAIMITYLLLPIYKKIDLKYPKKTLFISIILYLIFTISISMFTNYKALFIFINRIPIILLGFYFAKENLLEKNNKIMSYSLFIIGVIISYTVFKKHISINWFYDIFYITNIPLELGFLMIFDNLKENKIYNLVSDITLELYGLQMIFGFKLANTLFRIINIPILTNIIVIVILILISKILKNIFNLKKFILN